MKILLFLAKYGLMLGLLAIGVLLLFRGGDSVSSLPFLKYKELEAHRVPAGIVLIAAAIALAYFWRIEVTEERKKLKGRFSENTKSIYRFLR